MKKFTNPVTGEVTIVDEAQVVGKPDDKMVARAAEITERLTRIQSEIDEPGSDYAALLEETKALTAERAAIESEGQKVAAKMGEAQRSGILSHSSTRSDCDQKVLFRSGEKLSAKYGTRIDVEKCLRAAITGNRDYLTDAEKRAVTPTTGGAMLAPDVSAQLIDNMRESDWMQVFQPTVVDMTEAEMKIPNITKLPDAVMHSPGVAETPSDPVIDAATLNAKTIMVLVEVANELLKDALNAESIITRACTEAVGNKLLQQVLYGTGVAPEMKGIITYAASDFADAGDKSAVKDLYSLATAADSAIIRRNGHMNGLLYDVGLEERLNKRLATGELVEPSRAFQRLYSVGRTLAHPSIADGDMLFIQANELYIGFRGGMEIDVDWFSSFNSYNTKFRVILRGDIFANAARMAYYSNIPAEEPA